jgi:transcriptional regulator with XRE-family HTH domain
MLSNMTYQEWEAELGQQLRSLRLRQNINQQRLAEQSGVALNVIKNLESGKGATIKSLIKVLRSLNHENWLTTLAPTVSISPLQMLKGRPLRQRASKEKLKQQSAPDVC